MKILIFGASGMLGNNLFNIFSEKTNFETYGVVRNKKKINNMSKYSINLKEISDVRNYEEISRVSEKISPDVIINCVGIIKQREDIDDKTQTIQINSLLPHLLLNISKNVGAKFIHFSTDCVFSGKEGNYTEKHSPDAEDIYGLSKRLGEINGEGALTLRTSIIGHELDTKKSLIDWFLSQKRIVKGFKNAIFSGLTTTEISKVLENIILNNDDLEGLFHLSVNPINKFDLLKLVAEIYKKDIKIIEDNHVIIDRSLNSSNLRSITGYNPPSWRELITELNQFYNEKFKK
tara:strand:+ start:206 stop:1075 length:870 start_codon:yes stop_codon:yes gene_type:complete